MPINIPLPQLQDPALYTLEAEILRRAVDGTVPLPNGQGLVLVSPNGTKYRLGVDNDGALTTTPV